MTDRPATRSTTTPPTPTTSTPRTHPTHTGRHTRTPAARTDNAAPPPKNHPGEPVWSLRTQQRASATPTPRHRSRQAPHTQDTRLYQIPEPRARPTSQCSTHEHHPGSERPGPGCLDQPPHRATSQLLLRKEVIQPHLPVRLPCYDFVPIADPTFDSSPPHGLGHWLRVLPTFVT